MKKVKWIILVLFLCFLCANPASAALYVGGKVILNEGADLDYGYGGGIQLGWDFTRLRFEGELEYRSNDIDNSHYSLKMWDAMANGYFDFFNNTMFTPYVGGGIGYAWFDFSKGFHLEFPEADDAQFVYQFCGGVLLGFKHLKVDLQYRYFTDTGDYKYESHNFSAGLRFGF